MLAKSGHTFDGENLTDYQVQAYSVISSELARIEQEEMKRKR